MDKGVIILVRSDDPDRKPQLYACPQCGRVHSPRIYAATDERAHQAAREAAENCYNCKTHNDCSECGAECPKGWTACEPCRYTNKLAAAEEVPDDGGPYCAFDGDTYYYDMDEAVDAGLEWVSPCHTTYPKIDPDDVIDGVISNMHDDASVDDLEGVEAFYQAVKPFTDKGISNKMRQWCDEAGLPQCSLHGLRKATSRQLAQSGATDAQGRAVTGHKKDATFAYYARMADRERLAEQALSNLAKERESNAS